VLRGYFFANRRHQVWPVVACGAWKVCDGVDCGAENEPLFVEPLFEEAPFDELLLDPVVPCTEDPLPDAVDDAFAV
jgi:hypothetical protein